MSFVLKAHADRTQDFTITLLQNDKSILVLAAADVIRVKIGKAGDTPELDLDSVDPTASGSSVVIDTLDPASTTLRLAQGDIADLKGTYDIEINVVDDSETLPADAIKTVGVGVLHIIVSQGGVKMSDLDYHIVVFNAHVVDFDTHVAAYNAHITEYNAHVAAYDAHVVAYDAHIAAYNTHIIAYDAHVAAYTSHVTDFNTHVTTYDAHVVDYDAHIAAQVARNSVVRYANEFDGADIGAKVNAAIADLPDGGGTVVIPGGSYTFSTPMLTGSLDYVSISGQGPVAVKNSSGHADVPTDLTYTGAPGTAAIQLGDSVTKTHGMELSSFRLTVPDGTTAIKIAASATGKMSNLFLFGTHTGIVRNRLATGGSSTTLEDTDVNFAGFVSSDVTVGSHVVILKGAGRGQVRKITNVEETELTVSPDWDTAPASKSEYVAGATLGIESELYDNGWDLTHVWFDWFAVGANMVSCHGWNFFGCAWSYNEIGALIYSTGNVSFFGGDPEVCNTAGIWFAGGTALYASGMYCEGGNSRADGCIYHIGTQTSRPRGVLIEGSRQKPSTADIDYLIEIDAVWNATIFGHYFGCHGAAILNNGAKSGAYMVKDLTIFSNHTNGPDLIHGPSLSVGTATSGTATTLVDSEATFVSDGVEIGHKVKIIQGSGSRQKRTITEVTQTTITVARWGGIATSGTSTTLTDDDATFLKDGVEEGDTVTIIAGTGASQEETITKVTETKLTVASWSIATPDDTSEWRVKSLPDATSQYKVGILSYLDPDAYVGVKMLHDQDNDIFMLPDTPTASAGLPAGTQWSNGGSIEMV